MARTTRQAIIDAAEILFANEAPDAVTVATITKQAGQRNQAAVHYHFGGRDGLLASIIDQHHARLDDVRFARLAELDAEAGGSSLTLETLAEVIVRPMVEELGTASGRAFLRIQGDRLAAGVQTGQLAASMVEIGHRLIGVLPPAPEPWRAERARLAAVLVNARLAQEAMAPAGDATDPTVLAGTLTAAVVTILSIAP